jgi:hypothetical protein
MNKRSLDSLTAELEEQRAAVVQTVDQLRVDLSAEAVGEAVKAKAIQAARSATFDQDGRLRRWVMIATASAVTVVVLGVVLSVARRAK